jgi:hypothetical protein
LEEHHLGETAKVAKCVALDEHALTNDSLGWTRPNACLG